MKTFVTFALLLVTASFGFGQSLINRLDPQIGEKPSRIEHRVTRENSAFRVCLDRAKTPQPQAAEERSIAVTLLTPDVTIGEENYANVAIGIQNITALPIKVVFERSQQIPEGWTTSVCDPNECHSSELDILPPEKAYTIKAGEHVDYHLSISPMPTSFPDTARVYLLFKVIESTEVDTAGVFLMASTLPQGAVRGSGTMSLRPSVRAIYPSPLISGHTINVSVQTTKEVGYKYSIVDPFGREVAFGTSQRKLMAGDNLFGISSLEGLTSGSYLLKLNFSDGSSDTYPFSVVR
jgi:hypothetical protein